MGRLLEVKKQMVDVDLSEFHYFDDLLLDLKMAPEDLEVPIPRYFLSEKMQVMKDRQRMLARVLDQRGLSDQEPACSVQMMSLDEALRILQVCERARQGRLRARFINHIYQVERGGRSQIPNAINPDQAAICIQKVWRGYTQRKRTKQERIKEMIFLGMLPAGPPARAASELQQAETRWRRRRLVQEQNEDEYLKALLSIRKSVQSAEETDMRETLREQIRQWFIECRDATGKFPDFPDVEDGGSAAVFTQNTPGQVAAELRAAEEERERRKKRKDGKKKEKKGKKRKEKTQEDPCCRKPASIFLPAVLEAAKAYRDVWQGRDESQNLQQHFDPQLVREEKRKEVEQEVRVQVDELMRHELKVLKLSIDHDNGQKTKIKKGSKKKKKKNSKMKDLTKDRSIESLYEELLLQGVIIRPMSIRLSDYIGEHGYLAATLQQTDMEATPPLSDVRQLIALCAVLPLGSHAVHEKAPLLKSLLLAGPAGVGKKMLVHAICTETGANLFNLSAKNLAGKYPGRHGTRLLLHLVFKVARLLQPSVIWIEDAEKTFYRKVPKTEREMEPKRMKKDLPKALKGLNPEDRVLLVGTSRRPFDADLKPFCKVYEKVVLIPRPDYASRLVLWEALLCGGGAAPGPGLDLSCLAKISDGYTQGHMVEAVCSVLRPLRLAQLRSKPLTCGEFITPLARLDPVFREEEEAFKSWYSRTPLARRKSQAAKRSEDRVRKPGKGEKKKKDDKSKTKKKKKKKKEKKKKK
ncbi:hypothetical protein LDENG_00007200 [Lucifuga dentata]|nr:hypothetical protein LDENG_00007200 [Lucifuga dentata]